MHFSRLRLLVLASSSSAALAMACGAISDPTNDGADEPVATVSGALTGSSVPANARVALVWRTATSSTETGGYAVGDDVAVVNGKFTMSLAVPAAACFTEIDGTGEFSSSSSSGNDPMPELAPAADPGGSSRSGGGKLPAKLPSFDTRLAPRNDVSGGFVTSPLSGAVAGFVVYVDANGNGKLDLSGAYASSTDTILGGNKELILTYLRDGGALDYEKLRDTSGILPTAGFNLAWTVGKRWMPLNVVQLKLDPSQGLPGPVCSLSGANSGNSGTDGFDPVANPPRPSPVPDSSGGSSSDAGAPGSGSSGGTGNRYPSPTDPNLHCSPDGRSFLYDAPSHCPPPPPARTGLCANGWGVTPIGCASAPGWGEAIAPGTSVPANWPCPVAPDQDGGPAPDAGNSDAGK